LENLKIVLADPWSVAWAKNCAVPVSKKPQPKVCTRSPGVSAGLEFQFKVIGFQVLLPLSPTELASIIFKEPWNVNTVRLLAVPVVILKVEGVLKERVAVFQRYKYWVELALFETARKFCVPYVKKLELLGLGIFNVCQRRAFRV